MIMKWTFRRYCIDPVCGKRIKPVKSGIAAIHGGCAYYFCSPQCWAAFQEAPSQYVVPSRPTTRSRWRRTRPRVEKATVDNPSCCH